MRIAIFGPEFPPSTGGESEYAAQVAQGLFQRGHQVVVFSLNGNNGRGEGYEVFDVLQGRQISDRKIIDDLHDFDAVHVMNAAWCWLATCGKPTFLSIFGNDFISPNPIYGYDLKTRLGLPKGDRLDYWLAGERTRRMMRRCLPLCNRIFVISEYSKQEFLLRYPQCDKLVVNAGLGVSSRFLNGAVRNSTRSSAARILTVCRLSERRKNVDLIIRALARLKPKFAFRYCIVGDGYLRSEFVNLCRELGILDRVTFAGKVSDQDMRSFYEDADLFVMPSGISKTSFEGFGIVYLEANAVGVPTLALRAAGAQEAVDEGHSGFFVEEATVEAIEEGIRSFLGGEKKFSSEECRRFALQFTWARVIDKFEGAYADTNRIVSM